MQVPEIKTKRCPLCRGVVLTRVRVVGYTPNFNLDFNVQCLKCGCQKTTTLEAIDLSFGDVLREMEKAVSEWNMRSENLKEGEENA